MKNFKVIVALVALIAASNACAAESYPAEATMFPASDYYNDKTGLFTEEGISELVKNVKEKYYKDFDRLYLAYSLIYTAYIHMKLIYIIRISNNSFFFWKSLFFFWIKYFSEFY